jgi:uncharacterized membrane protein YhiD involved in acid resistance
VKRELCVIPLTCTLQSVLENQLAVAAQFVSGIGFLGVGTILMRKEIVEGLTTTQLASPYIRNK